MAIIVILGDQLNDAMSALRGACKDRDVIIMAEVMTEATYVAHHQLKLAFIFSAMRHFAARLLTQGYQVSYCQLDDANNPGSLSAYVRQQCQQYQCYDIIITEPSEWRVLELVTSWRQWACVDIREDDRFFCSHEQFKAYAAKKKQYRLEHFYQQMRKQHQVLMQDNKPIGGQWNFDVDNRKKIPNALAIPNPTQFVPDACTLDVIALVKQRFAHHPGNADNFYFAQTREQALVVLDSFLKQRLHHFGDYQDAMKADDPWLFHSHISFYLNCGLLLPREVISAAIDAYQQEQAPLNAVEGFVRQVLGWREFVRGIYWLHMPEYANMNALENTRSLPEFFWHGETRMRCLSQSIKNTLDNAYAHHIQRLMVIGNFSLLVGLDPKQVQAWYLAIYADAFEWVEMPNVVGMILFADNGLLASKPYISSGNYINKMSDYCKSCDYNVKEKIGDSACPFNYLYWNFLIENKPMLHTNPRLAFPYKSLSKMSDEQKQAIQASAKKFIDDRINS